MGVKRPGNSQGLNPRALRAKRDRDRRKASEQYRIDRRGDNHKLGQRSDSDLHHTKSGTVKRTSIAYNRATHTRGEVKS